MNLFPWVILFDLIFLLLSSFLGLKPHQETRCLALGNAFTSGPISARTVRAERSLTPGIVWRFFICSSNSLLQISRIFSMHLFLLSSNKADSATYCASMSISASETTPVSAASIVSSPCLFIMRLCTSISSSCGEVTPSDIRLTTFL